MSDSCRRAGLESEMSRLPAVSPESANDVSRSLAGITNLATQRLETDACFGKDGSACPAPAFTANLQQHFGRFLRAVYEFGLWDHLAEHLAWIAALLASRGLAAGYLRRMLDAWNIAVLGSLRSREANGLSRRLALMAHYAEDLTRGDAPVTPGPTKAQHEFLALVRAKQRRAAADFALDRRFDAPALSFCSSIIFPVLAEIGRLWHQGRISVADEHAATEICRYVIFRLFDAEPRAEPLGRTALVACVPGEEHELAPEVIACHLESNGWQVYFIGHSTPEVELIRTVKELNPGIVLLAVTLIENLPAARELLKRLNADSPGIRTILGGRAAAAARTAFEGLTDVVTDDIDEGIQAALKLVNADA